jgi:hypothetical protein
LLRSKRRLNKKRKRRTFKGRKKKPDQSFPMGFESEDKANDLEGRCDGAEKRRSDTQ